jgi:phospholipid transport system substrate-binding protein
VLGSGARAEDITNDAGRFVADLREHLQAIVDMPRGDDPTHDRAAQMQRFRRLFLEAFDVEAIGRYSLGRYWTASTTAQRQEFQSLFERDIVVAYAGRFVRLAGRPFNVVGSRAQGADHAVVISEMADSAGARDRITWRVLKRRGTFKIVDVMVHGVSISMLQRADYRSFLDRSGGHVETLLDVLRRRAAPDAAP